jgi:hypothetical protein
MNLSADEFMSLSTQLSDRDVRVVELEKQLEKTRETLLIKEAEIQALTQRLAEMELIHEATEIENRYLKQYLWLSWSKIKNFMSHIHDIRLIAFIQTFMLKTVSEEMGARALEVINEAVQLPDDEVKPSTHIQADQVIMQNSGTVNGPTPHETATKTDKQVKQAVEQLMAAQDAEGAYIMQDQEQWYAVKAVLTQQCGFPMKPADFERSLKNLGLDQLRIPYVYDSVRKVHAHQLPGNVELWHQYQNTADEYSHKQVAVAVRLMELLSKVRP